MDFNQYKIFIFDFDGVILDSNAIKTRAFHEVALPFGEEAASELVRYHTANGGISRFLKFEYLFKVILKKDDYFLAAQNAVSAFGAICKRELMACPEAPGISEFMKHLPEGTARIVVSGGAQDELRMVARERGLAGYFHAVFGSPDTKFEIFQRELDAGRIAHPFLMFGDSKLDYEVTEAFGGDFVFMSGLTEFKDHQAFFRNKARVRTARFFTDFLLDPGQAC